MPHLVLSQHAQPADGELRYKDVEGSLYHYPAKYFPRINGYEPFIYYRPQRGAPRDEQSSYVGYGRLRDWFDDARSPGHRFVRIEDYRRFTRPVRFADDSGALYESGYAKRDAFQGNSVREIGAVDFVRILAAAGVRGDPFANFGNVDALIAPFDMLMLDRLPRDPPRFPLVAIDEIPEGAGYIPSGRPVDLYESAALQERARADHQGVLQALAARAKSIGAATLYNNNIDLLVQRSDKRILIEAKSLNDERDAVDRMRYGLGQLLDYGVRYRAELADATPLLAFGRIPSRDVGWLAEILEQNRVGFAGLQRDRVVVPLNQRARDVFLFG